MENYSEKRSLNRLYILIFISVLVLVCFFPYSGDDWAWGSKIGIERLNQWFDNYSGRYFGNLIVLALTRSAVLKVLTMAICISGIIIFLSKLTGEKREIVYMISASMIFMPVTLLRQSVVWTAGFSNYTTSIFLTLIYIYYIKNIYEQTIPENKIWHTVPLFILGIVNALIVEHMTIYNMILGLYVIIFTVCKYRKAYLQHIAYFVGTVFGAIYMFSNSVYRSVATGADEYREIADDEGIITRAINNFFDVITKEAFLNNTVVCVILFLICFLLWKTVKINMAEKPLRLGRSFLYIIAAYTFLSVMNAISGITQMRSLLYIEGAAVIIYVLALIGFILALPYKGNMKIKSLFGLISALMIIAPLLVVSPIGSRCFFAPYIMIVYLIAELYSYIGDDIKIKIRRGFKYMGLFVLVGYIYLLCIYGTITINNNDRIEQAKQDSAAGKKSIEVQVLPYKEYVWCSEPYWNTVWEDRFKLFYGLNDNIEILQKEAETTEE